MPAMQKLNKKFIHVTSQIGKSVLINFQIENPLLLPIWGVNTEGQQPSRNEDAGSRKELDCLLNIVHSQIKEPTQYSEFYLHLILSTILENIRKFMQTQKENYT